VYYDPNLLAVIKTGCAAFPKQLFKMLYDRSTYRQREPKLLIEILTRVQNDILQLFLVNTVMQNMFRHLVLHFRGFKAYRQIKERNVYVFVEGISDILKT
jgi:hypothetical protein